MSSTKDYNPRVHGQCSCGGSRNAYLSCEVHAPATPDEDPPAPSQDPSTAPIPWAAAPPTRWDRDGIEIRIRPYSLVSIIWPRAVIYDDGI